MRQVEAGRLTDAERERLVTARAEHREREAVERAERGRVRTEQQRLAAEKEAVRKAVILEAAIKA